MSYYPPRNLPPVVNEIAPKVSEGLTTRRFGAARATQQSMPSCVVLSLVGLRLVASCTANCSRGRWAWRTVSAAGEVAKLSISLAPRLFVCCTPNFSRVQRL